MYTEVAPKFGGQYGDFEGWFLTIGVIGAMLGSASHLAYTQRLEALLANGNTSVAQLLYVGGFPRDALAIALYVGIVIGMMLVAASVVRWIEGSGQSFRTLRPYSRDL